MTNKAGNRMIQINGGIIGPREPKAKKVIPKTIHDYPGVSKTHLDIAEVFSSPSWPVLRSVMS